MKVHELLYRCEQKAVVDKLIELYPGEKKNVEGYNAAYQELLSIQNIDNSEDTICFEIHKSEFDDEEWVDVYFLKDDGVSRYALDFKSWHSILGMNVNSDIFTYMDMVDVFAHILFEITYYGFSNAAVSQKFSEILDIRNEVLSDL